MGGFNTTVSRINSPIYLFCHYFSNDRKKRSCIFQHRRLVHVLMHSQGEIWLSPFWNTAQVWKLNASLTRLPVSMLIKITQAILSQWQANCLTQCFSGKQALLMTWLHQELLRWVICHLSKACCSCPWVRSQVKSLITCIVKRSREKPLGNFCSGGKLRVAARSSNTRWCRIVAERLKCETRSPPTHTLWNLPWWWHH